MLSLNHLSSSTISPRNKLPSSTKLPADPVNNIWYFYNTISCNAYLDGHKILNVLSIPLLDDKESYEIYKIHNLPLSKHGTSTFEDKTFRSNS